VSLRYEALVMDDKVCPGLRACWTDPWRFWRRKAARGVQARIEGMVARVWADGVGGVVEVAG
jgi:hypothetical protein